MKNREGVTNLSDFRKNSAEQLTQLISDLADHNDEHGAGAQMGKSLGRAFGSMIESGEKDLNISKNQAETTLESAQAARTRLEELTTKYEAVIGRFGLALNHRSSEGLRYGLPSGPLALRITDARPFIRYLQSLKNTTQSSETTRGAFAELLKSVEQQLRESDSEHPSPATQSILENIDEINAAFTQCSSDIDTTRLSAYAEFQKTGRLAEFIRVENAGLWQIPGKGFGPGDWYRDASPNFLENKWAGALTVLKEQKLLGERGVSAELRAHLLTCLNGAIAHLPDFQREEQVKIAFSTTMEKYRAEIEQLG